MASRNLKSTISALAKIAVGEELFKQLNISEFTNQAKEIDRDIIAKLAVSLSSHPYLVNRLLELEKFHISKLYKDILKCGLPSDLDASEIIQPLKGILDQLKVR